jgi:hypothetical protein
MDVWSSLRASHHQENKPTVWSPHIDASALVMTGDVLDAA